MRSFLVGVFMLGYATACIASETITYTYDANGRLIQASHSGSVNNGLQSSYTLDKADNRTNVTVGGGGGVANLSFNAGPTPSSVTAGVATTVQATLLNSGTGSASGSGQSYFQFLDASLNCTQPNFCGVVYTSTGAIAAGGSAPLSVSYTFPVAGTYDVRVCVNDPHTITESNYNDDCSPITQVTATSGGLPNLAFTTAPTPSSATHGVATTLQNTLRNTGAATASGSGQSYFQILDINHNCTQPNFCAAVFTSTGAIAAGGSAPISGAYTFPIAGTYTTRVCVNDPVSITESNYSDDCSAFTIVNVN